MKDHLTKFSLGCLLCLLTLLAGCFINIGSCAMQAKYERTVDLSAALSPDSTFAAQTHNGSITVNGAEGSECRLKATIVARAATEEDAQALAEKTEVTLEPSGDKLTAKIDKPRLKMNQSISVSFDVNVPIRTDLELVTHNGAVVIADITGRVNATTHNGKVTAGNVSGSIVLETHNGAVDCTQISGDAQLKTHNGGVQASYSQAAPPVCNVSIVTYNGGIEFTAPPGFSAEVRAATHNGSVHTDLPVTVVGETSKSRIEGSIGTGQGKLHLETHNGSIRMR
jgi:hypothetical protein